MCQRKWRDYVVTLPSEEATGSGRGRVLGVPMDMRVPKIRFATQARSALQGRRLIVRIDTWPVSSCWPEGHFVEDLGPVGDLDTETRALLSENSIKAPPFGAALLAEMPVNTPEQPWKPSPEEVARRRDIRHSHLVFSIDPKGCEDVDDVLGARRLPNGNLELSVHIADVTYGAACPWHAWTRGPHRPTCSAAHPPPSIVVQAFPETRDAGGRGGQ